MMSYSNYFFILMFLYVSFLNNADAQETEKKGLKNFVKKVEEKVSDAVDVEKGGGKMQLKIKPFSAGGNLGDISSSAYQKLMMEAIKEKDVASLKKYIELGANPNLGEVGSQPNFPIVEAFKQNCVECVEIIAPHLKDVNNVNGLMKMPIVAACNFSLEYCKKCVEDWGADVNGYSLHFHPADPTAYRNRFNSQKQFMGFSQVHRIESLKYLIEKGATPRNGNPNVMEYVSNYEPERLEVFLKAGANPDHVFISPKASNIDFRDQKTPLHICLKANEWEQAKLLLKYGAKPNQKYLGNRPLYYAIRASNVEMVAELLAAGADPNQIIVYSNVQNLTALGYAAENHSKREVVDLLIKNGAK